MLYFGITGQNLIFSYPCVNLKQFLNIFIMDKSSFQSSKTENCVDKMSKQTLKAMFTCLHIHGYFLKGAVFHFCFKISVHVPKANYVNYCQEDAKATLTI